MSEKDWELVPYSPVFRQRVLGLMAEVQGHETSEAEFVWWFEQNPTKDLNIFLAVSGDRVIGVSCHNTFLMSIAGKREIISFPLNVLTHEDFRGRGIFSALEKANERHAEQFSFMLSYPNAASTPIFVKMGWERLLAPRLLVRPRRLDRLMRAVDRVAPISLLGRLANPFLQADVGRRSSLKLEPIERFETWADDLFAANEPRLGACIVRDSRYLNWRFVDDPNKKFTAFRALRGKTTVGYVVVGLTQKKGCRVAFLASGLLAPDIPNMADELRALARGPLEIGRAHV